MKFTEGQRAYVIAEIGANHNGDMDLARRMIDTAKECGADAVKFQSWDTGLFAQEVYDRNYFLGDDYRDRTDYTLKEIVDAFALDAAQMAELSAYCRERGIDFATTPFSPEQLDELVALDPPFIKIASMDLNNDELLKGAGETGRTVLLSTGFGAQAEIEHAVETIESTANRNIVLLHCVSLYPPEDAEVNLNNMDMLRKTFGYPVGFSDHTLGTEISLAAIAKGAVVLEKHYTLDKTMFGWDHSISADPGELSAICRGRDRIYSALGARERTVGERELSRRGEYRRSVVSGRDIKAGETITPEMLAFKRPGTGIAPNMAQSLHGMIAARDIPADTVIRFEDLRPEKKARGRRGRR